MCQNILNDYNVAPLSTIIQNFVITFEKIMCEHKKQSRIFLERQKL